MTAEQWRPIPGYEGFYEVSDLGRVRSVPRLVAGRWGSTQIRKGRVLRSFPKANGYLAVGLSADNRRVERTVHSLVAEAFLGTRPDGMQVCHGGGDKSDNRASNLRYDTPRENVLDKQRQGRDPYRNRSRCPRGHLLAEPNLKKSQAAKGQRACLSCDRTRRAAGGDAVLWQQLADEHYSTLEFADVAA